MRKGRDRTLREPADVARELERERMRSHERTSNGLAALSGTWTEEEFEAFEQSVIELTERDRSPALS